jgi:DNA-binding beta-propeller fold protein YncE
MGTKLVVVIRLNGHGLVTWMVLAFAWSCMLSGVGADPPFDMDRCGDISLVQAAAETGTMRLRDIDGGSCLAFSRDGKTLATGSHKLIRLWNVRSGVLLKEYQVPLQPGPASRPSGIEYRLGAVTFSEGNRLLAAVQSDTTANLYDMATKKEIGRICLTKGAHIAAVSADGKFLASIDRGLTRVSLWDIAAAKKTRDIEPTESPTAGVAFSSDGGLVATCDTGRKDWVHVWEIKTGRKVGQISLRKAAAHSTSFSPDGKTLAVTYTMPFRYLDVPDPIPKIDYSVDVFDLRTGKEVQVLLRYGPPDAEIAFSPDGKKVAVVGGGEVILLDAHR